TRKAFVSLYRLQWFGRFGIALPPDKIPAVVCGDDYKRCRLWRRPQRTRKADGGLPRISLFCPRVEVYPCGWCGRDERDPTHPAFVSHKRGLCASEEVETLNGVVFCGNEKKPTARIEPAADKRACVLQFALKASRQRIEHSARRWDVHGGGNVAG